MTFQSSRHRMLQAHIISETSKWSPISGRPVMPYAMFSSWLQRTPPPQILSAGSRFSILVFAPLIRLVTRFVLLVTVTADFSGRGRKPTATVLAPIQPPPARCMRRPVYFGTPASSYALTPWVQYCDQSMFEISGQIACSKADICLKDLSIPVSPCKGCDGDSIKS